MSNALCFQCGSRKKEPTRVCDQCVAAPRTFDELVLSYCLSLECVKPKTLKKCREYFKTRGKPPRFRAAVVDMAACLAEQHAGRSDQSIEFSSALFEFTDLDDDGGFGIRKSVDVQVIGRIKGHPDEEAPLGVGKQKTWHRETWVVGQDIPEEQVQQHMDGDQLFVWYRWINDRWAWSCVSRGRFAQLKAVEDGRPF